MSFVHRFYRRSRRLFLPPTFGSFLRSVHCIRQPLAPLLHSHTSHRLYSMAPSFNIVQFMQNRVKSIELTIQELDFVSALRDIDNVVLETKAYKNVSFIANVNSQHLRDSYYNAQFLHSQVLQSQNKLPEALKLLNTISDEFAALHNLATSTLPAPLHTSRMAKILKAQIDLCLISDEKGKPDPAALAKLESFQEAFSVFEPFADCDRVEVISFYAQLARGYILFQKYPEAKEVINKHILFDLNKKKRNKRTVAPPTPFSARDSVVPASYGVYCRHLEGRHCLAMMDFEGGEQNSYVFDKLYEECHDLLVGLHAASAESRFLSELAVSLRDEICNIAILQGRLDDVVTYLRNAIASANDLLSQHDMQVANALFTLVGVFRYLNRPNELKAVLFEYIKCGPEVSYVNSVKVQKLVEIAYSQFFSCSPGLCLELARTALRMRRVFVNANADKECALMSARIANHLQFMRNFQESIGYLKSALPICTGELEYSPFHRGLIVSLATAYVEIKRASEAVELLQAATPIFNRGSTENLEVAQHAACGVLHKAFVELGSDEKALESLEKGIKVLQKLPDKSEMICVDLQKIGSLKLRLGDNEGAVATFEELLKTLQAVSPPNERAVASARRLLAGALVAANRLEEAADQFRELVSLLERDPSVSKLLPVDLLVPALQQYVQVLRTLGRHDDAAAVESKITDSSESKKICQLLLTASAKPEVW